MSNEHKCLASQDGKLHDSVEFEILREEFIR